MALLQIHMIKSVPASNLNRGEDGKPKSVWYGGVNRIRVSSQSHKRAIRMSDEFRDGIDPNYFAIQTRSLPRLLVDDLQDTTEVKKAAILGALQQIGKKEKKEEGDGEDAGDSTNQLLRFTAEELKSLGEQLSAQYNKDAKLKGIEKVIKSIPTKAIDLAMFGRMSTSAAFDRVDAAVQVAHWISADRASIEEDFLTAVDDLTGTSGFLTGDSAKKFYSAPVFYAYAAIDTDKLVANLDGDQGLARKAIYNFILAYSLITPSGSQNSYAAHVAPDFLCVEYSTKKIPLNYAPAFAEPVKPTRESATTGLAITALQAYIQKIDKVYGIERDRRMINMLADESGSLIDLVEWAAYHE